MLRHSEIWEAEVRYEWYKSGEIIIKENTMFVNLKSKIATKLEIGELRKKTLHQVCCKN